MTLPVPWSCRAFDTRTGVTNPPLGNHGVGKCAHSACRSFQHRHFEATRVIKMHVHARDTEVVVLMERADLALRQGARLMIKDVA